MKALKLPLKFSSTSRDQETSNIAIAALCPNLPPNPPPAPEKTGFQFAETSAIAVRFPK